MSRTSQTADRAFTSSLDKEQQEIERLLEQLETESGDFRSIPGNTQRIRKLEQVLQDLETLTDTHFICEEHGLFPVLKKYHSMVLMEKEHDLMLTLRKEVKDSFLTLQTYPLSASNFKEAVKRFAAELRRHFQQEQKGIYRIAERDLSPEEKEQVVHTMEALRTKAASGLIYTIQRPERHFYPFKSESGQPLSRPLFSQKLLEHNTVEIKQISIRGGEAQTEQWAPTRTIVICQRGKVTCRLKDEEIQLEPGSGILIEPGLVPVYQAQSDSDLLFIIEKEQ